MLDFFCINEIFYKYSGKRCGLCGNHNIGPIPFDMQDISYLMTGVHSLVERMFRHFFLVQCDGTEQEKKVNTNSCNVYWSSLAMIVLSTKKKGPVMTNVYYAEWHTNFHGIPHMIINLMWLFLSPNVTVVPVYVRH